MNLSQHDEPALNALSPRDVAGWLRLRGFSNAGPYGEYGVVFSKELDGTTKEVILPTTANVRDFGRRMEELVTDLAEIEDAAPSEILSDLILAPFDVVKVRSPDADDYGSVRLTAGLDLHTEARNLILASANAAASPVPRRSWRGRRFEEVGAYLDSLRLGQTQRGSFILTILSRWDFVPDPSPALDLGQTIFGRRVTQSLAGALLATEAGLRDAVAGGVKPLVSSFQSGVSSNFCNALASLVRDGDGVDVSVLWSPARPEPSPVLVRFRREDASALTEAAATLSHEEADINVTLEGPVTSISEEPERFDGSVVLETILGGAVRRVRVKFAEAERSMVFDAAREKRWIRVVGDLKREGNRLALISPRDLALLAGEKAESELS